MIRFFLITLFAALSLSSCSQAESKLNVMTFNIRVDTRVDSLNAWNYRKDFVAECIVFYQTDIAGLQEVMHHQLEDLKSRLPEYSMLGVGRFDGKTQGEYSPIVYRRDRFEVLKSETFWLSEDPTAVGRKGWDAACERIVTWANLRDKCSGQDFYFFNTHFDHLGKEARRNSSLLMLAQIKAIAGDKPVILTGDFNSIPTDEPITILTDISNADHLSNTAALSSLRYGPEWSFHSFGRIPVQQRMLLDYIFVRGGIRTVTRHGIVDDRKDDGLFLSDHNPVLCTLIIGKQ
jgi:endonuclease/exonuclease/phosphatase family metal-dependent hydrolase